MASGLIPAHAGKTVSTPVGALKTGAHPRSRGENVDDGDQAIPRTGSSPLTRGKPRVGPAAGFGLGLIPAHAGKTEDSVSPQ